MVVLGWAALGGVSVGCPSAPRARGYTPETGMFRAAPGVRRRVGLVIGNSAYRHGGRLQNPERDIDVVGSLLSDAGFQVTKRKNLDKQGMRVALREFAETLQSGDIVALYYSGHGFELSRENYLMGVDFTADTVPQARDRALKLDEILGYLGFGEDPDARAWATSDGRVKPRLLFAFPRRLSRRSLAADLDEERQGLRSRASGSRSRRLPGVRHRERPDGVRRRSERESGGPSRSRSTPSCAGRGSPSTTR